MRGRLRHFRPFLPVVSRIAFILIRTAESGAFYEVRSEHHFMTIGEQLVLVWTLEDLVFAHPCSKNPWQLLESVENSTRRMDPRFLPNIGVPISNEKKVRRIRYAAQ